MALAALSEAERAVVCECIRAVVDGPFLDDRGFGTLMGLSRDEAREALRAWPDVHLDLTETCATNAMVNLLGYPHGMMDQWGAFISVGPADVAQILKRLIARSDAAPGESGQGYFDYLR